MVHLIDKDALIAEIKRRYEYWREKEHNSHSIESEVRMSECQYLMLLLNTLEVKEVEEPASKVWHDSNEEQPNYASTVAIWYPEHKNGEIISRCVEVYSDRIWAYIEDLLKM